MKALSSDHNTGNPKERERVYAMGGTIKENRLDNFLHYTTLPNSA
jgi:hypothetical protein